MSSLFPADTQPTPKPEFELELLKQEYFFLQTTIEDYNKQIWVIKTLGIAGTGAVIALSLQQKQSLVPIIGCGIPLLFWVLESQWKHFQRGFYPRVAEIERILALEYNLRCPAIFCEWSRAFRRGIIPQRNSYFWEGLFNPSVYVSYALEIVFLLVVSEILTRLQ
ncbi:MAG TPA: hypothetical protein V6D48_15490 [Oculatellaceae cyanobacterium]